MDELAGLADGQHGVFSLDDARAVGVSQRMIDQRVAAGRYERVAPATYRVVGASPTWRQAVMRVTLAAGRGAAASHATALALHRVARATDRIHVLTVRRRRLRIPDHTVVVHTATALPVEDITTVTGIPTTAIDRTLLDYAGRAHPDALAAAIDRAIGLELTSAQTLGQFLERRRRKGRSGVLALEAALGRPALGTVESRYERTLLEMLESAGLRGVPQLEVRDEHGRFLARVDVGFPRARLAIEVDGHEYHATREQRAGDAARQNRLHVAGWTLLRVTSDQVYRRDPSIVTQTRQLVEESSFQ